MVKDRLREQQVKQYQAHLDLAEKTTIAGVEVYDFSAVSKATPWESVAQEHVVIDETMLKPAMEVINEYVMCDGGRDITKVEMMRTTCNGKNVVALRCHSPYVKLGADLRDMMHGAGISHLYMKADPRTLPHISMKGKSDQVRHFFETAPQEPLYLQPAPKASEPISNAEVSTSSAKKTEVVEGAPKSWNPLQAKFWAKENPLERKALAVAIPVVALGSVVYGNQQKQMGREAQNTLVRDTENIPQK